MRILILGGTGWLGRYIAASALERGLEVTCLARGASGTVVRGATFVRADRSQADAYDEVRSQRWDVVIDLSRHPAQVESAVQALTDRTGSFVFVSSISVYADHSLIAQNEEAPILPPLEADVMETMGSYGEAKVACEQHVLSVFADRALIARAGLIGGPGDESDRSGYWPIRFSRPAAEDGSVLVPHAPELATQLIDVRDLAAWLVPAGTTLLAGIFNVTGDTVLLPEHLDVARRVSRHTGRVVEAEEQWLLAQGVEPWMGARSLPLWLVDPQWVGFNARDSARARGAGLAPRPLRETLADTLAWELRRDRNRPRRAGLSDEDERGLLAAVAKA